MALAVGGALEPTVFDRAMRRKAGNRTNAPAAPARRRRSDAVTRVAAEKPEKPAASLPSSAPPKSTKPSRAKRKSQPATALETTIGYRFSDPALLERALTHISALKGQSRAASYQRLEFLGDHVLGLAISEMLFDAFPKADEGELSRRLADLVRRETCGDVARVIDLGAALRLGASEIRSGGRSRIAILADVCESLIGAVFLDGGYDAAKALVERFWAERMRKPARPLRDPKTVLQEWAQARGLPTPSYREVERTGPHHSPEFRVAVTLPNRDAAEGKGRSKRAAEQAAAAALLAREGVRADV